MRRRIFITLAMILCFGIVCSAGSFACTGVYVGTEVSTDGTVIIARSSDFQNVWGNHVTVTPRVEGKPGRTMPLSDDGEVQIEIPQTTYHYTATPFFASTMEKFGLMNDATASSNEYGVAMTMAVTAFANLAALEADPYIEKGLTENTAADLVICQSKTAREAVEVLLGIIDEYGSSESNIALIADQKEAWYVEMYGGHQYAAVKLPADKVCVFGNEYSLEYLSDYEDSIVSADLLTLPEEKGFAVYGKGKKADELNLFATYSGKEMNTNYCHMRTWIGHQILAPSRFHEDYDIEAMYPLCFTPDKKVSIADVCNIMRNRFEGTKYDPDKTGRIDMRVIGTDTALSVHALQVYPDLPAEMACVTWESTGPAIYGVFVPVSNAMTSISSAYGKDQPASEAGVFDSENYPYYAFKDLSTRCVGPDNYKTYGAPVKKYWHAAEKGMFAAVPKVLEGAAELHAAGKEAEASEYITGYCNAVQDHAFTDAVQLLNDVTWTESADSNTMKLMRNPETHQTLNKERVLDPMEVSLDPSEYEVVPDTGAKAGQAAGSIEDPGSKTGIPVIPVLVVLLALAVLLEAIALVRSRKKDR